MTFHSSSGWGSLAVADLLRDILGEELVNRFGEKLAEMDKNVWSFQLAILKLAAQPSIAE